MPQIEITKNGWECCRCGHKWEQKEGFNPDKKPLACPKCRSPYWDIPKRKK